MPNIEPESVASFRMSRLEAELDKLQNRFSTCEDALHESPCPTSQAYHKENERRWSNHQAENEQQREIFIESLRLIQTDITKVIAENAQQEVKLDSFSRQMERAFVKIGGIEDELHVIKELIALNKGRLSVLFGVAGILGPVLSGIILWYVTGAK